MSRVLLVSMPWDQLEHPPIQLAILQGALERDGVGAEVHCLGLDFLDHCMAVTADGPAGERLGVPTTILSSSCHATSGSATGSSPSPRPTPTPATSDGCASIRSPSATSMSRDAFARSFRRSSTGAPRPWPPRRPQ